MYHRKRAECAWEAVVDGDKLRTGGHLEYGKWCPGGGKQGGKQHDSMYEIQDEHALKICTQYKVEKRQI